MCGVLDAAMSLSSAISESRHFPLKVRFVAPVSAESRDQHLELHGQLITVRQIYDSTILLANPIQNGMQHEMFLGGNARHENAGKKILAPDFQKKSYDDFIILSCDKVTITNSGS